MGEQTGIAWCKSTFNPWEGCTKVAPECDNCYAAVRDAWIHKGKHWGPGAPRRHTSPANWRKPRLWNTAQRALVQAGHKEPWRVFGGSLMDWADNDVDPVWREAYWNLIRETPYLTWLLLTKRMPNVAKMLPADFSRHQYGHVWLGTTAGTQARIMTDGMRLLDIDAYVQFLSIEPQLEAVNVEAWLEKATRLGRRVWVIVGGESGRKARALNIEWLRIVVQQCKAFDAPVFVKQMGPKPYEWLPSAGKLQGTEHALAHLGEAHPQRRWFQDWTLTHLPGGVTRWYRYPQLKDPAGADPAEWPEELRVQEFPA